MPDTESENSVEPKSTPESGRTFDDFPEGWPVAPTRVYRIAYPWMRVGFRGLARILAPRLDISGSVNVPRRGAVLLTPNHISDADPPLVSLAAPRPLFFMAKREIFGIKNLGPLIRFFGAFPVDPHGSDRAALRYAQMLLENKQAVVVFPEGRCSPSAELEPALPGAVMLALRAGAPVVPVGIWNTPCLVPYASTIPRPSLARVVIHFAPPIRFDDLAHLPKRQAREIATQRLHDAIAAARAVAIERAARWN